MLDQPPFLNTVAVGTTGLDPRALLAGIQAIESRLGRDRSRERRRGPRAIDIDLLLYGERIIDEEGLRVPHPAMGERKFVLLPLLELDPDRRHPESGERLDALLARLEPQGIYYFPG